jgi:hypothetical protein
VPEGFELLLRVFAIGIGATVTMDIITAAASLVLRNPLPDYAPVGRWIGHMAHGQFCHASISKAPPVSGEGAVGWLIHYVTGVVYAAILVAIVGRGWVVQPTLWPALILALVTLAVPFLIMQPAFGLGVASSKHPHPWAARLRSLIAHLSFGLGLYVAARLSLMAFLV